ncbi:transposase [Streptomyces griseorubiginosus]|uniref:transposase n=1 Tax=Streptomyces griseorubiginosus TaxID=67304 RepID=UPI003451D06F
MGRSERVLESPCSPDGTKCDRAATARAARGQSHCAHRAERTSRRALRNEHRDKVLSTRADDLDLEITKVRTGSSSGSLLERRRPHRPGSLRRHHGGGISTRSINDLLKALGGDTGILTRPASGFALDGAALGRGQPRAADRRAPPRHRATC